MKVATHTLLKLVILIGCTVHVAAQQAGTEGICKGSRTAPPIGSWTWAENARIKVYIRIPDFRADEVPSILTAIQNWDASYNENGSGVRFEYQGTVTEARTCDSCLTIIRGEPIDKRHGAELQGFSKRRDQIIDYAWIVIDSKTRKPKPLTTIVAHELGHSLGLLDCYSCKRKSTVMNQFTAIQLFQVNIINWSNDMAGPTTCDLAQVKEAYKELKRYVRPSPTFSPLVAVDEGEEPEEDDTPTVMPEP